jgi:hypothetical protein
MPLTYDLHLHSCLSPCADNDMTPANIAGFAKLGGLGLIALTDHNSAENLPYIARACRAYGVRLLPGIEMNTAEEIHLLCYLPTVETALTLSREIYSRLPDIPCREKLYGEQIVMDEDDREISRPGKFLLNACSFSLEEAAARCAELGGIAVPAHIDRDSFSVLSVLGTMPDEPRFAAAELRDETRRAGLVASGCLGAETEILVSSDAHSLGAIGGKAHVLSEKSSLLPLLERAGISAE